MGVFNGLSALYSYEKFVFYNNNTSYQYVWTLYHTVPIRVCSVFVSRFSVDVKTSKRLSFVEVRAYEEVNDCVAVV
jgi:hypothetical protein